MQSPVSDNFQPGEFLRRWNWSGHECCGELRDARLLISAMLAGVENSGASVRRQTQENFLPHGVTLVLVLAESHFVVSTWPEFRFASIDIGICSDTVSIEQLTRPLLELLVAGREDVDLKTIQMCREKPPENIEAVQPS